MDGERKPIPGTERDIECDLLVLAVGLIPENELSLGAGIQMDPVTKGPLVDESLMTSIPGIFACGNVAAVFDLVDYVSLTGETAARSAVKYIAGKLNTTAPYLELGRGENVGVMLPQRIRPENLDGPLSVYLRVAQPLNRCRVVVRDDDAELYKKSHQIALPPEMLCADISLEKCHGSPVISVEEV